VAPYVKTSLAPGSRVVASILRARRPCWDALDKLALACGVWLHHLTRQLRTPGCDELGRWSPAVDLR